ncbi:MAG: hypothetical protein EAZ91_05460 [Cytophagales bacterium]|nr:MAG: hypothetical protein EAZ91_05460 [Cytophagales bacterium]
MIRSMNMILLLTLLVSLADLPHYNGKTTVAIKADTLSARQRHPLKFALDSTPKKSRWYTVFARPAPGRSGNGMVMPIGFNQATVRVNLGDRLLQLDKDYVFVSEGTRLLILDQDAFTSEHPLRVTYERLSLGHRP